MQLDAVETGGLRARAGSGKERGQRSRELANVRQIHIGDVLAIAELQVVANA